MKRRQIIGQIARLLGLYAMTTLPTFAADYVYTCGNHHPPHSATSPEEAAALTIKFNCENWDVASVNGERISPAKRSHLLDALGNIISKAKKERGTR
jgi:hypothetical protein